MATANDLLTLARKEIGIKESPLGTKNVKYNTAYWGRKVSGQNYAWCAAFIWWLFYTVGAPELYYGGGKTAYCPTLLQHYKEKGQLVTGSYKPGDLIFFDFNGNGIPDHIGICESFSGTYITTIDGNTGSDEANGGTVARKNRHKKYICGAARPAYSTAEKGVNVIVSVLKKGSKGKTVKALQFLLIGYGYDIDADSSFGPATENAVKKFQKSQGLAQDGSVGPATWNKLLGV